MTRILTAINFFKSIEKEKNKYKLVNGLFIVKYDDENESHFVGELIKGKINKIKLDEKTNLKYNSKKKINTTTLGFWKPLNINFIETQIIEVLK